MGSRLRTSDILGSIFQGVSQGLNNAFRIQSELEKKRLFEERMRILKEEEQRRKENERLQNENGIALNKTLAQLNQDIADPQVAEKFKEMNTSEFDAYLIGQFQKNGGFIRDPRKAMQLMGAGRQLFSGMWEEQQAEEQKRSAILEDVGKKIKAKDRAEEQMKVRSQLAKMKGTALSLARSGRFEKAFDIATGLGRFDQKEANKTIEQILSIERQKEKTSKTRKKEITPGQKANLSARITEGLNKTLETLSFSRIEEQRNLAKKINSLGQRKINNLVARAIEDVYTEGESQSAVVPRIRARFFELALEEIQRGEKKVGSETTDNEAGYKKLVEQLRSLL